MQYLNNFYLNLEDALVIKYSDNYAYISSAKLDSMLTLVGSNNAQDIFWHCVHNNFFNEARYKKYSCIYLKTFPIEDFTYE